MATSRLPALNPSCLKWYGNAAALCLAGLGASAALAQTAGPAAPAVTAKASVASAAAKPATPKITPTPGLGPAWQALAPGQQEALKPLQAKWDSLSETQKRKWIALVPNYHARPAAEQAKLHSRMAGWANLSPQQRAQARLNFGEAGKLAPDERKAKWDAYQNLSAEEKKKLAAGQTNKPVGAATAVKPVPQQKLADVTPAKVRIAPNAGARTAQKPVGLTTGTGPAPGSEVAPAATSLAPVAPAALAPGSSQNN
ncbi:MAG: DUF3106 domain-containing protein [Burkholderiaceae bacterium]